MRILAIAALIGVIGSVCLAANLPRSTPEEQGVSSAEVYAFVDYVDRNIDSMNSFMLVRHGHVIAEGWWSPYDAASPHSLYSLSKSFTSTAVGLAAAEGKLRLSDPVLKFFPDDAPTDPSANLKAMRISDLLRMSTGQQTEPARPADGDWVKTFLSHPVPFKPGTHFLYNTSGTYMLSAIVQKAVGQPLLEYLTPSLFEPLGIEHPTWEKSPQGINTGGYGLSVRTEDIARFGQLYLQKGMWNGKQLLPESWVRLATARQTSNGSNPGSDWDQGYGYQFWRCRHNAYRGDGAFGQYCVVMPDQDAVVVITSGVVNMQAVLNVVWDKLLPAMGDSPLPPARESQERLASRLKDLSLRAQQGSATAAKVDGKKFAFAPNPLKLESLVLETSADSGPVTLKLKIDGKESAVTCERGGWRRGRVALAALPEQPVAASGAWTDDGQYTAKICFYETPFIQTVHLKFEGDTVRYSSEVNVGFGQTKQQEIVGKAE